MLQFLSTLQIVSSRLGRARMFFVALAGILFLSGMAHATLIPSLVEGPTQIGINQYAYDYRITLSPNERLDVAATSGNTCPATPQFNNLCVPPGTFVTLYDIPGLVSASTTVPNWTAEIRATGLTPSSTNPNETGDLSNVTFEYNGPVFEGESNGTIFFAFRVVSVFNGINPVGNFTSQSTNDTESEANGTTNQTIGTVPIPIRVGITAATANIGGRIMTSNGKGIRGVKVTITGTSSGVSQSVLSGDSGNYSFPDMESGETYIITVTAKQYTFAQTTQLQMLLDDRNDINFIANVARRFN